MSQFIGGLNLDALKMLQQGFCLSFLLLSFISSFLSVSATKSIIYTKCSQLSFTSMTPYDLNLNSLFTLVVDSASTSNFNTFEISTFGSSQSDVVYGLFQCQGDLSSPYCKDCMVNSASQLKKACPVSVSGTIQLEGCSMKYDNNSFFGIEDKKEVWKRCGPSISYNPDVLTRLDSALTYLIVGNKQYFHEGGYGSVQGAVQCIQDLSLSECQDCLLEARGRLRSECETSTSGDMYLGKCYIRYVDQEFQRNVGNGNNANDYYFDFGDKDDDMTRKNNKNMVFYGVGGGVLGGIIIIVVVTIYKSEKVRDKVLRLLRIRKC